MLDINHDKQLIDELWESAASKVRLTESLQKFFEQHGAMPLFHDNRRAYHRYFMRGKAVVLRGDATLAAYTKDVSRQGIGFLSPVQLMPKERVKLHLPTTQIESGDSPLPPRGSRMLRVRRPIRLGARLDSVHELR